MQTSRFLVALEATTLMHGALNAEGTITNAGNAGQHSLRTVTDTWLLEYANYYYEYLSFTKTCQMWFEIQSSAAPAGLYHT